MWTERREEGGRKEWDEARKETGRRGEAGEGGDEEIKSEGIEDEDGRKEDVERDGRMKVSK